MLEKIERQNNLKALNKALRFLKKIRIPVQVVPSWEPDPPDTFFQGCWLEAGTLWVCKSRAQVGEVLHEAGHLALLPRFCWESLKPGQLEPDAFGETYSDLAVEAWDYCAAIAAGINEALLLKNMGLCNGATTIDLADGTYTLNCLRVIEQFHQKQHLGIYLLLAAGFFDRTEDFPHRINRWLWGDAPTIACATSLEDLDHDHH